MGPAAESPLLLVPDSPPLELLPVELRAPPDLRRQRPEQPAHVEGVATAAVEAVGRGLGVGLASDPTALLGVCGHLVPFCWVYVQPRLGWHGSEAVSPAPLRGVLRVPL